MNLKSKNTVGCYTIDRNKLAIHHKYLLYCAGLGSLIAVASSALVLGNIALSINKKTLSATILLLTTSFVATIGMGYIAVKTGIKTYKKNQPSTNLLICMASIVTCLFIAINAIAFIFMLSKHKSILANQEIMFSNILLVVVSFATIYIAGHKALRYICNAINAKTMPNECSIYTKRTRDKYNFYTQGKISYISSAIESAPLSNIIFSISSETYNFIPAKDSDICVNGFANPLFDSDNPSNTMHENCLSNSATLLYQVPGTLLSTARITNTVIALSKNGDVTFIPYIAA